MSRWDVYRDDDGVPVTLTQEQFYAVWHAISTVNTVRAAEKYPPLTSAADYAKSRLLGRMLMDGRPPLDEKPPDYVAARGYHLVEPDLPHWYLGSTPFLVTVRVPEPSEGEK